MRGASRLALVGADPQFRNTNHEPRTDIARLVARAVVVLQGAAQGAERRLRRLEGVMVATTLRTTTGPAR